MVEVQGKGGSSNIAPAGENAFTEEWHTSQTHCTPKEPQPLTCPKCGSNNVDKNGHRYIGEIDIQRYLCQKTAPTGLARSRQMIIKNIRL